MCGSGVNIDRQQTVAVSSGPKYSADIAGRRSSLIKKA
jgi:hypothetical protein